MEKPLVPCGPGVTGPCDLIATKAEDIAGVWKQYFLDPFFHAPGGVAYIRFNADGTFTIGDSVENTAKGSKGYTSGWITFAGQQFSFGPVTGAPPPCNVPPIYQMRVLKYGDKPVALRFVLINDDCAGRVQDFSQALVWVANPGMQGGRAIAELRSQVADLALQAAGRLVKADMNAATQRRLVDEFLAEVTPTDKERS